MKRLILIATTALVLTAAAGIARPGKANAQVNFSDGVYMMGVFTCKDAYAYPSSTAAVGLSSSFFQSQPAGGYFRTWTYDHQRRSWMTPTTWRSMGANPFLMYGTSALQLPRGYYTFQAELGRYVNGRWQSGYDNPVTCFFVG